MLHKYIFISHLGISSTLIPLASPSKGHQERPVLCREQTPHNLTDPPAAAAPLLRHFPKVSPCASHTGRGRRLARLEPPSPPTTTDLQQRELAPGRAGVHPHKAEASAGTDTETRHHPYPVPTAAEAAPKA